MTLRAIGAATEPPWPPFSTITATAMRGCSTGAKATNRAWSRMRLVERVLIVFLALLDAEHLRRAGFAGDQVGRVHTDAACRAARAVHHAGHGVDDLLPGIRS